MPSRKSNKNLMHLPPLPAPEGRRCITVAVPDEPQWIALFYGALFRLSQQVWYDRDAAHSAKDVAAVWQQVYLETLNETGDCMNGCLCFLRRNPATGRYQYSTDGLDWFEVDDGPWIDAPVTPQWPAPVPREGTDNQKRCDAAYAAALVLQSLYQQTWGVFINWANWSAFTLAQEMADWADKILGGLFNFDTLISAANELHDNESAFQDGGFPDSLVTDVQNILYCQSSVIDGAVVFDFDGVLADFAAVGTTPYPGINFLLQLYIGEGGLNAAGNVQAGSGDCSDAPCDETWCHEWNFESGWEGWSHPYCGYYDASIPAIRLAQNCGGSTIALLASIAFDARVITKFEVEWEGGRISNSPNTKDQNAFSLRVGDELMWGSSQMLFGCGTRGRNTDVYNEVTSEPVDHIYISIASNTACGDPYFYVYRIRVEGVGTDPFGGSNCE